MTIISTRTAMAALVVVIAGFLVFNARSLYEGIFFYLAKAIRFEPTPVQPVSRNGRYASLYDLVRLTNAGRHDYLSRQLEPLRVVVTEIPVPGSPIPNIFVRFRSEGPYTLFSAHYDKYYDNAEYQGASDNTAAVSVLLASIVELANRNYAGSSAFLFVAAEETGLQGSQEFVKFAAANGISIRQNINFDDLGRGKLAIRPSAPLPGFVFSIPFYGDVAFDGKSFRPSPPFPPVNQSIIREILQIQPDMVVLERFTVLSDSNTFQSNGIDVVSISADDMRYIELTWDTYYDRVEWVDEGNLERAFGLVTRFAEKSSD